MTGSSPIGSEERYQYPASRPCGAFDPEQRLRARDQWRRVPAIWHAGGERGPRRRLDEAQRSAMRAHVSGEPIDSDDHRQRVWREVRVRVAREHVGRLVRVVREPAYEEA